MVQNALLLWWSTNTRACSVLADVAVTNNIKLCLVLDPKSKQPSKKVLDKSVIFERHNKLLSRLEFERITSLFLKTNGKDLILAPTSEYIMDLISQWNKQKEFKNVIIPFKSFLDYRDLSSKEKLYSLQNFPKEILPKLYSTDEALKKKYFYAKPKVNIVEQINLKPFLVTYRRNRDKFLNLKNNYFPQQLVKGKSIYLCAYFSKNDTVQFYFQENIIQNRDTTSVIFARYVKNDKTFNNALKLINYLNLINYKGVIMAEFKGNSRLLIEINPRFWGPLLLDLTNECKVLGGFFDDYFKIKIKKSSSIPSTPFYIVPSQLVFKFNLKFFLFYLYKIFNLKKLWSKNNLGGDW